MMSTLQSLDDRFRSPHNPRAVQSAPTDLSGDASPLLDSLAHFATTLDLELVPSNVRRQAGLCILDTIGCILACADTTEGAARLDRKLSPAEQQTIVNATRTPHRVRWPEWWSELP